MNFSRIVWRFRQFIMYQEPFDRFKKALAIRDTVDTAVMRVQSYPSPDEVHFVYVIAGPLEGL